MGGVENIWGNNIYYYITTLSLFRFFRNSQHPEKWSVTFREFLQEMWIHQLLLADVLKFTISVLKRNFEKLFVSVFI